MKKKLSILMVSCVLLSTPCFAFDKHHHPHKKPPKHYHHIFKKPKHFYHDNQYYNNINYSYSTQEDVEIAKIQSITDIITAILD